MRFLFSIGDLEQNRIAVNLILGKIAEDPHSGSCPSISYVDIVGPVASAYPTGSPYAMISNNFNSTPTLLATPSIPSSTSPVGLPSGNLIEFITNPGQPMIHQNKSFPNISPNFDYNYCDEETEFSVDRPLSSLRVVKNILQLSGFSDAATDAISRAVETICKYGLTNNGAIKSAMATNNVSSTKSGFPNISLYDSPPLYGSPNSENANSNDPLDFLINSYLNHNSTKRHLLNENSLLFTDEIYRNIDLTQERLGSLGSVDDPFLMNIRLKTNTKMKVSPNFIRFIIHHY